MKEEKLIELIHKRSTNQLTAAESEQLNSFLADEANQKFASQIELVWQKSVDYKKDYQPNVEMGLSKLKARMASEEAPIAKVVPIQSRRSFLRIAVAAAILLVGGWFAWNVNFSSNLDWQNVAVAEAKTEFNLADGSQVWVNDKSNFTYPTEFSASERLVKLSGEAFFDISKNPKKPFIIESGDLEIKVLGTSFNVRNYDNENFAQVTVRSGKVQVTSKSTGFSKILTANDRLVFNKSKKEANPIAKDDNLNDLAWWSGKIEFPHEESRRRIVEVVEHAYNVKLEITNPDILNCTYRISTDIKSVGIEGILRNFELGWGLKEIKQVSENKYKLVGGKCERD